MKGMRYRRLRTAAVVFAAAAAVWIAFIQWKIYSVQQTEPSGKADVGIVLGAALWNNVPSPGLKERLDHALQLYRRGYFPRFIVSGGLDGNGAALSEAEGMRNYLLGQGVPEKDIVMEKASYSTYENLINSRAIMNQRGWKSAIIVTHQYHGARAKDIARFIGMDHSEVSTFSSKVLNMYWNKSRETLAFTKWELQKLAILAGLSGK